MTEDTEHNTIKTEGGRGDDPASDSSPDSAPAGKTRLATVLQVLPAMETSGGGVERGTVEIAQAITEAGGRAVVASSGGRLTHELKRVHAEHIDLPLASKNPFIMYGNIARLAHIIKEYDVDIVHARSRAPAWSAYFAARRTGAHFVTKGQEPNTYNDQGWMSSVAFSPTLNHFIGLGFIKSGSERLGEVVIAADLLRGASTEVKIVSPHFVDPEGERLRA